MVVLVVLTGLVATILGGGAIYVIIQVPAILSEAAFGGALGPHLSQRRLEWSMMRIERAACLR